MITGCGARPWLAVCACVVLVCLAGCGRPAGEQTGAEASRLVLRIGFTPSEDTLADREDAARALAGYLERQLDVRCEVVRTASYEPAIEAMARGEIDLISFGPFAYVLANQRGVAEAIVVTGRRETGPRTYSSVIVARRGAGLDNLDDLHARAPGLRFNFTDPASTSGHLAPRAWLAKVGIAAERDFASVEFTMGHAVALLNVSFGEADVAGANGNTLQRLETKGRISGEPLVVLWRSEPIPSGPVAIRSALRDEIKRAVQRALVDLSTTDPKAAREVMTAYSESDVVFLPCDDSHFAAVHELGRSLSERTAVGR